MSDRWYTAEEICAILRNRIKPRNFQIWARKLVKKNPAARNLMGWHDKWHSPFRRTRWRLYHADLISIYATQDYLRRLSGFQPSAIKTPAPDEKD